MPTISLLRHDLFRHHQTPQLHPESPERLSAIDQAIAASDLNKRVALLSPRLATENEICAVHVPSYVEELERSSLEANKRHHLIQLDADTFLSAESLHAAKLAAGAGLTAVESVAYQDFKSAFVAVRPPGHHALANRQMGFCLFNNIALAARYAQYALGYKRVLIIDWDVHHGNGTEAIFYDDPSVLFISIHQFPIWPESGWFTDDGVGEGKGFNVNLPLPAGTGDRGYLAVWDKVLVPICLEYEPDLILLSAGYDGHQLDPLGGQMISTIGYAMLSQRLADLSRQTQAKTVCFLEGGYNKKALAESVVATLRVLSAEDERRMADVHVSYLIPGAASGLKPVTNDQDAHGVDERIEALRKHFSTYWQSLRPKAG